jgi:hypothetical protein
MSSDGNTLAIAGPGSNQHISATRIYDYDGNDWVQRGLDIVGEELLDRDGDVGGLSLSSDGNVVAVSTSAKDLNGGNDEGRTRIFEWDGNAWVQRGSNIDGESGTVNSNSYGDRLGAGLSLSANGNTIAIGGPGNGDVIDDSGHVRIYDYDGNDWVQRGLNIQGTAENLFSGDSVSMTPDGNTVLIGTASQQAYCRIFDWDGNAWVQRGLNIGGTIVGGGDGEGYSIAISSDGNTIVSGIPGHNNGLSNFDGSGRIRIYDYDGNDWVQRGSDLYGRSEGDDAGFGLTISSDGNTVAIGYQGQDNFGFTDSGGVRIYDWDVTTMDWVQRGQSFEGDSFSGRMGWSIVLSGDANSFAVSSPNVSSSTGLVQIFDWACPAE